MRPGPARGKAINLGDARRRKSSRGCAMAAPTVNAKPMMIVVCLVPSALGFGWKPHYMQQEIASATEELREKVSPKLLEADARF